MDEKAQLFQKKVESLQQRVQEQLLPVERKMTQCALDCYDQQSKNGVDAVHKCVNRCQEEMQRVAKRASGEFEALQSSVQACHQSVVKRLEPQMESARFNPEAEKALRKEAEAGIGRCIAEAEPTLPGIEARIKEAIRFNRELQRDRASLAAVARLQQTYGDGLAADAVGGDGRGADDLALLQQTPAGDAKASAADMIAKMDRDGDGMISEMDAKLNAMTPPQIRSLFSKVDGNKDGQISQEEMAVYKDKLAAQQSPEFSSYKKQDGRGVMGLIEGIIAEARAMELEAIKAEHDSQTAYEEYMKDSNKSIKTLNKAITDKTERKAAASARNTEAKSDRSKALDNADSLEKHKKTLHQSCDFVLNNFDARQEARGAEIRALGEAKAILSGA